MMPSTWRGAQQAQEALLAARIMVAVGQQHVIAGIRERRLGRLGDRGVRVVGEVRHHEADGARHLGAHRLRRGVGRIAEHAASPASTRARVSGLTSEGALATRETVTVETPAARATSLIGRLAAFNPRSPMRCATLSPCRFCGMVASLRSSTSGWSLVPRPGPSIGRMKPFFVSRAGRSRTAGTSRSRRPAPLLEHRVGGGHPEVHRGESSTGPVQSWARPAGGRRRPCRDLPGLVMPPTQPKSNMT